jgi:hypothetical protein
MALLLPGLDADATEVLALSARDAAQRAGAAHVSMALVDLAAGDDIALVGREVEALAIETWRREHAGEP